jgi:hypothetical protein
VQPMAAAASADVRVDWAKLRTSKSSPRADSAASTRAVLEPGSATAG